MKYGQPTPIFSSQATEDVVWQPVAVGGFEPVLEINQDLKMTELVDKEKYNFWEHIFEYCSSSQLNDISNKINPMNA